jgi:hypothetical protein
MNLVEINEYLKGAPLQLLGQYANGKDPIIPAYMATGEIARREAMKQRMAVTQQAAQGKVPTVKEQVEQKAGLMSLQAQQQQQGQQRMMEQARAQPMPIPEQTPQPREQAEETEMARGGIARLPVRGDMYDFARGGIIAFAEGDQVPAPETQPTGLGAMLNDPAARKAAMAALTPEDIQKINQRRLEARKLAGVTGEYGEEQRKRLSEEEAQYKEMLKDRGTNRLLAVLSGMGRGGLGGAAPAYLQTQAAEQAADMAQKRRLNQLRGDIDAKRRAEQMGEATGMSAEEAAQRKLAGTVGGTMYAEQMRGLSSLEAEDRRAKNELKRQEIIIASNEKIARMSEENRARVAQLDRDLRVALHATPSASLESQAIQAYVANGLSPTEAYERVKTLALGYKGNITQDQATDNVQKYLESPSGMMQMNKAKKEAEKAGATFDPQAYRDKLIQQEMSRSSSTGGPAGKVDTSNPLLK